MAGLISDQLLAQMRSVAYKQLLTNIAVKRETATAGTMGTTLTEATVLTTKCWFKPAFKGDLTVEPGGLIGKESSAEIRFEFGLDIRVGDYVVLDNGERFQVQDTNAEATIALYGKAWVQRID